MTKNKKIEVITAYFNELLPNVGTELIYHKDYELLIAVMLSAQTTDVAVNKVTPVLFSHFPSLNDLAKAEVEAIANDIKTIGLYKTKAKNVKAIAMMLLENFQGVVPREKEQLLTLPGVGNKTANVVRAELFKIPEIAVDTHVSRVSKRLGLASPTDNPDQIEAKLRKLLKKEQYISFHHQAIHFGRYHCLARSPKCYECKLVDLCLEKNKRLTP